ncbi:hypothetical protein jhhlp_002501 [Lomentospora prolificans]|uniref:FZ domain-containing protein n=1 Tax=Lomentospora prolificans TaxID=41688 RepID=A0A2N3NE94_9PEZI|nr:hypothetical protein jhhlp_002501 [Lomentospora prolificans]
MVVTRQTDNLNALGNNDPERFSMDPGSIAFFAFSVDGLARRTEPFSHGSDSANSQGQSFNPSIEDIFRRQTERTVFISANVCRHPENSGNDEPEPLRLIVSYDPDDQFPDSTKATTQNVIFFEGSAMQSISISSGSVYFSIEAPPVADDFAGEWNLEVAVSDEGWYHSYAEERTEEDNGMLWAVDVDGGSALLMTKNLTESHIEASALMTSSGLPFTLFVDSADSKRLDGVRRSYCGLQNYATIASTKNDKPTEQMLMSMTTRGLGSLPKQQFWFGGLNTSTVYSGILVRSKQSVLAKRQSTASGSGVVEVFPEFQFQTTEGDNCRVITDLEFCNETEYAVPANSNKFSNATALAKAYDDYARSMYQNFEKAMMQIPCEAPITAQYSLARTCDDCKRAYKTWLCTVAMPRCEDISSTNPNALIRNAQQEFPNGTKLEDAFIKQLAAQSPALLASRNSWIDEEIAPGPYKEVLPCDDLCYNLVQSCPAALGFGCPLPKDENFKFSYAQRGGGQGACNFPISATFTGGSMAIATSWTMLLAALGTSYFAYI